jgi:hypothetical protein
MVLQMHTIATRRLLKIIEDLTPPSLCAISHFYVLLDPTLVSHLSERQFTQFSPTPKQMHLYAHSVDVNPA